ncbi:putative sporulation protein YtxC [Clostridium algidicarnis]|uniref:putative sporulation protein YtxC n=1 Tax=Clostridium algidicarnis TaxID=37659 RepID=UPI001C0E6242|nr:putative sporulation protein YtxC [Clostridium algidicarnis]MBU3206319.1 putative sporulation protein YtxC [Clostridium algidicarnis]
MDAIKIESTISAEKINQIIEEIPIKKDVIIDFEEYKDRYRYIFSLNKKQINQDKLFLKALAKFVNKVIIKFYTEDMIALNIEKKIGLIDSLDKSKIIQDVKGVLTSKNLFINEKEEIEEEISKYFLEHDILIIDGYLNFRSKSFNELVDKAIELVLGNFQLEVEYSGFIDMLKALVESQVPEVDLINIVLKENKYILMDSNKEIINNNHMSMVIEDLYYEYEGVSEADILLSTVIALSPKKIVMHLANKSEDDLTSILEEIFEDRFEVVLN